jgi:signal transduction histidine kinase
MALTFGTLLYFQILYLEKMVKMRHEQFTETVMKSMYGVASYLERQETLFYLEQDAQGMDAAYFDNYNQEEAEPSFDEGPISHDDFSSSQKLAARYKKLQDALRTKYRYQQGLLNEVILSIMQESGSRNVMQRADSTVVRKCLKHELSNFGLNIPFAFGVASEQGRLLYSSSDFKNDNKDEVYTILLFPNSETRYKLLVSFPTQDSYIFSSVRFIIPTLAFTVILLVVFLFTIILAFRQKKLTEMKNDFINNMTHEIKTPITSISLAAQMLGDPSLSKSQSMLTHLSKVITTESKRLRMLAERVLLLSMFDKSQLSVNLKDVDANEMIDGISQNFKIRAEKSGGSIECDLKADKSHIVVDSMHFTNVIYNLLDNALKYQKEDTPVSIKITTENTDDDQLSISIKDNGIGIKKDDLKRIFERFYRVSTGNRHDVKGFGIGLAYVKQVITQVGGNIKVESDYGKGTTFIIKLPVIPSSEAEKQ